MANFRNHVLVLISCCYLLALAQPLAAQDTGSMSVDELFAEARTLAYDGFTDRARVLLNEALKRAPDYTDVRLFLGRTYAWDGDYNQARSVYNKILDKHPKHQQTWQALVQVELWSKRYPQVLETADKALKKFPKDTDILYTKAQALIAMGRFEEAQQVKNQLANIAPNYEKLGALQQQIYNGTRRNVVSWINNGDFFSDYYDAGYQTQLQYERKAEWGSVLGRMNIARRFDQTGLQAEIDVYPKLGSKMYAYLNYGYSGSALFPLHRIGAELYRGTSNGLEYSAGIRHLRFQGDENISVFTASASRYFGNWWVSLRPFYSPFSDPQSGSIAVKGRRFMGGDGNYLGAEVILGAAYGERLIQLSDNTLNEEAYLLYNRRLALEWLHHIDHQFSIQLRGEWGQQELSFNPDEYIWIYSLQAGLHYRF